MSDHVLGADRAALPDFKGNYDLDDSFHETFATLSFIAGVTEKVALSTGILILPQRQTARRELRQSTQTSRSRAQNR